MLFSPQRLLVIVACLLSLVTQLHAQATSREEEIRQQRTDKRARLWPERTSGIVKLFDNYTETGLVEGARSKKGKNGTQFLLGGMRSGNGTTFGVGYRRVDLGTRKLRSALRLGEHRGPLTCLTHFRCESRSKERQLRALSEENPHYGTY
jgi:hypothetical protein